RISKFVLITLLFYITMTLITYNSTDTEYFIQFINDSIPTLGLVIWFDMLLRNDPENALRNLSFVYSILIYINLILLLLLPSGFESYYSSTGLLINYHFLGVYNQFGTVLFPGLIVNVMYSMKKNNKINIGTIILIGAVLLTFLLVDSATSFLGISLILLYFIIIYKKPLMNLINAKYLSIAYMGLFLIIVVFNYQHIF